MDYGMGCYDQDTWSQVANMNIARHGHGCILWEEKGEGADND